MNTYFIITDNGWCNKIANKDNKEEVKIIARLNKGSETYKDYIVLDFEQALNLSKELSEYIN